VEGSCEFGIEPPGKLSSVLATRDLSSSAQLHGVSYLNIIKIGQSAYVKAPFCL
jgi:hypothetical protein